METFESAYDAARKNPRKKEIVQLLKIMRVNKRRDSGLVVEFGIIALSMNLGDERWPVLEQVFVAALDTANDELSNSCLDALLQKFKDSSRVKRLVGMQNEAKRQFSAAAEVYDELLESNPANALAMKRRVALLKGQGKLKEAMKELNKFIDQYAADPSAWQELGELYLSMSKYDSAAFCFEEQVLHDPMNHLLLCRLAEIYFTMGGVHLLTARKYFAQSLEFKKSGNLRSLHGLAACCHAIAESGDSKQTAAEAEVNSALHDFASVQISKAYAKTPLSEAVVELLQTQRAALDELD